MNTAEFGTSHDVVVVGAGAAGVGVAIALRHAGIERFVLLDRHQIASSFANWPIETRFITPSFPTNSIGMLDLNSIAIGVSPGFSMEVEHPTGPHYAQHLRAVAEHFELPVRERVEVTSVTRENRRFRLETSEGVVFAKQVIWAAGEFQYPNEGDFVGSGLCRHTATIDSYNQLDGEEIIIIGGFESGIDAAYHLAYSGKRVRVFDSGSPWLATTSDPSIALSPFTLERMREDRFDEQVALYPDSPIARVQHIDGGFEVTTRDNVSFRTAVPPLLANGFRGSHHALGELFESREDGFPKLNAHDESTLTPGLFLCGPAVRQDDHVFCFIYKYRQRFAVVAKAIANALGKPAEGLEMYRTWGMYLDDLSCCGEECLC